MILNKLILNLILVKFDNIQRKNNFSLSQKLSYSNFNLDYLNN